MKTHTLTTLLLTGTIFACSQNVYAEAEHNNDTQELIQALNAKMKQLQNIHDKESHESQTDAPLAAEEQTSERMADDSLSQSSLEEPAPLLREEEDGDTAEDQEEDVVLETKPIASKIHELITFYMNAKGNMARMAAKTKLADEFKINHEKACFGTVQYIVEGGDGVTAQFGTLFSLMNMKPRYATKGNEYLLKGVKDGTLSAEILCSK